MPLSKLCLYSFSAVNVYETFFYNVYVAKTTCFYFCACFYKFFRNEKILKESVIFFKKNSEEVICCCLSVEQKFIVVQRLERHFLILFWWVKKNISSIFFMIAITRFNHALLPHSCHCFSMKVNLYLFAKLASISLCEYITLQVSVSKNLENVYQKIL